MPRHFRRVYTPREGTNLNSEHSFTPERTSKGHARKRALLFNLRDFLITLLARRGKTAGVGLTSSVQQRAADVTSKTHEKVPLQSANLARSLLAQFQQSGKLEDLQRAIDVQRRTIDLTPDNNPEKIVLLDELGHLLRTRFERLGELDDLEHAMQILQTVVELTPHEHPEKPTRLANFGTCMSIRAEHLGKLHDIEAAITALQHAVELTPVGDQRLSIHLSALAIALEARFRHLGEGDDLERAISTQESALALIPDGHPGKPFCLWNLGLFLGNRFLRSQNLDDIERTISMCQLAVDLTPDGDSVIRAFRLMALGAALQIKFALCGNLGDLERAIQMHSLAVELVPDHHHKMAELFFYLGTSLYTRFQRLGDADDLERAIVAQQRAADATLDDHPDKPGRLLALGYSLSTRLQCFDKMEDLESIITELERVAGLVPDGNAKKPRICDSLGHFLRTRFQRMGKLQDLESAITFCQLAVHLTFVGAHTNPEYLSNLATALASRFRVLGERDDIDRAIAIQNSALTLTPDGHPHKPFCLQILGILLGDRFRRFGNLDDIERTVSVCQLAVDLTPDDHPDKPILLMTLGVALQNKVGDSGDPNDLERAIQMHSLAVELASEHHPRIAEQLYFLGFSLKQRFLRFNAIEDIELAITSHRRASELTPEEHPDKVQRLYDLGLAQAIFLAHSPNRLNFDASLESFSHAARPSPATPYLRLLAAQKCVSLLSDYTPYTSAEALLDAHSRIIHILSEIAWLGYGMTRRYDQSATLGALVNAGVSVSIDLGQLTTAVEWLEAGRSLIWSSVLSLRAPLHDLERSYPRLAADLKKLSREIQATGKRSDSSISHAEGVIVQPIDVFASNESSSRHRQLVAVQYYQTLAEVRSRPGFEEFLRPPRFAALLPSPKHDGSNSNPVVFINVHSSSCDALAVLADHSIVHIALPNLTGNRANSLVKVWMRHLRQIDLRRRGMIPLTMNPLKGHTSVFVLVLGRLWTWVIHPILQSLNLMNDHPPEQLLPHVTWCPTGSLTQLPLHAAGIYDTTRDHKRTHIFDFVVSSYTPSLSALQRCYKGIKSAHSHQPSTLVIAQPETPGQSPLPGTQDECTRLRTVLPNTSFLVHDGATVNQTLEVMSEHPWVHFACHGTQDATDPTQSAFALYDGRLTLSALMRTVPDNAELAFLSACETAVGNEKIPEESAHLAAGMLVVGFKGVVATMWSIGDEDAPIVAEAYYKALLKLRSSGGVGPGQTGAAYALHEAAKVLRESVGEQKFMKWAPFVHFGV